MQIQKGQLRIINDFLIPKYSIDYSKGREAEDLNSDISRAFEKIVSDLPNLEGGGWIIISHSITQIKGAILLSLVVQR